MTDPNVTEAPDPIYVPEPGETCVVWTSRGPLLANIWHVDPSSSDRVRLVTYFFANTPNVDYKEYATAGRFLPLTPAGIAAARRRLDTDRFLIDSYARRLSSGGHHEPL